MRQIRAQEHVQVKISQQKLTNMNRGVQKSFGALVQNYCFVERYTVAQTHLLQTPRDTTEDETDYLVFEI